MSVRPEPPHSAELPEELVHHVTDKPAEWLLYLRSLNAYLSEVETAHQSLKIDNHHLRLETVKQSSIVEFQKSQYKEALEENNRLTRENERALSIASLAVPTPVSPPASACLVKTPVDLAEKTPARTPPITSEYSRTSERLPDPKEFNGTRSDLRRFTQQIYAKMTANADRFPTAQSRLAYVSGRLADRAYELVLPKTQYGISQFIDYPEMLQYLENAFGDPDRIQNAQNALYRLKQKNQDFSVFFAEFQRLALEGEIPEAGLTPLLTQGISRELQDMLLHNPAPSRDFRPYARHLQELDNRFHQHQQQMSRTRAPAPSSRSSAPGPATYNRTTSSQPAAGLAQAPTTAITPAADPMDLSHQQRLRSRSPRPVSPRSNRRERGECFRCGASDHLVRDCPLPDNRPEKMSAGSQLRLSSSKLPVQSGSPALYQPHPQDRQLPRVLRSPSPTSTIQSTNGMSLSQDTGRL
jgi:hypothetical protein